MGQWLAAHEFWDYDIHHEINGEGIADILAKLDRLSVIQVQGRQYRKPGFKKLWQQIYEQVYPLRPDLPFRLFGNICDPIDIGFLKDCTRLQNITLETEGEIQNLALLADFPDLHTLHLQFDGQTGLDFLRPRAASLKHLSLQADFENKKSRGPDLTPLADLRQLQSLSLTHYSHNLQAVLPQLAQLQSLHLRAIDKPHDLGCIQGLGQLRELIVQLGGIHDLSVLAQMPSIRYLQLWNIRKLENLDAAAQMQGLRWLFLQTLPALKKLPALDQLPRLRQLQVTACRHITDFSVLERCAALEAFVMAESKIDNLDVFLPILRNPNIQNVGIHYTKVATQKKIKALIEAHGKTISMAGLFPKAEEIAALD